MWTDLDLRLEAQNTTRNKIAHGTVVLTTKTKKNPNGRWVLAPYYHARKRPEFLEQLRKAKKNFSFGANPKEKMGEREIDQHGLKFFLLQLDLDKFVTIVEHEGRIQEGGLLAPDPTPPVGILGLFARGQQGT